MLQISPITRCCADQIFDIDDTLYPIECGFTGHRNGAVVQDFMVKYCGCKNRTEARALRDKYFAKFHSTVKALVCAAQEGALPAGKDCLEHAPTLGEWWAEHCDFQKYLLPAVEPSLIKALRELRGLGLKLVIFTNGPKAYALRVLETLQLREFFNDDYIFSVEDVLPACKPERAAFEHVLRSVGSTAARSVMFEDSMKNIQGCKNLGIGTVLLTGTGAGGDDSSKLDDIPNAAHPAVDAVLRTCGEMQSVLPGLWEKRFVPIERPQAQGRPTHTSV